jgi:hypothetical protein
MVSSTFEKLCNEYRTSSDKTSKVLAETVNSRLESTPPVVDASYYGYTEEVSDVIDDVASIVTKFDRAKPKLEELINNVYTNDNKQETFKNYIETLKSIIELPLTLNENSLGEDPLLDILRTGGSEEAIEYITCVCVACLSAFRIPTKPLNLKKLEPFLRNIMTRGYRVPYTSRYMCAVYMQVQDNYDILNKSPYINNIVSLLEKK